MNVAELLASRDHLLLDFDGPVCAVFGSVSARSVADRLKRLVSPGLPRAVAEAGDPFAVLGYGVTLGPAAAHVVESQFRRLEIAV